MQPSVDGEPTVGELPGRTPHHIELVPAGAGEQDKTVVARRNCRHRSQALISKLLRTIMVDQQSAAGKRLRLAMKIIDIGYFASRRIARFGTVIGVRLEVIAVPAGGQLNLELADAEAGRAERRLDVG